ELGFLSVDGMGSPRGPVPLLGCPFGLCVGPDGSAFVGQRSHGYDLLEFSAHGGPPRRLAELVSLSEPAPLPGRRVVCGTWVAGRAQVIVHEPGREPRPFVRESEETWLPAALLAGGKEVVLGIGPLDRLDLAVVPASGGGVLRRYPVGQGGLFKGLA